MKRVVFTILFVIFVFGVNGQDILGTVIPRVIGEENLIDLFNRIERDQAVKFFFKDEWLRGYSALESDSGKPLQQFLTEKFSGTSMSFRVVFGYAVVFTYDPKDFLEYKENLALAIAGRKSIESRVLGTRENLILGKRVFITGAVKAKDNNLPIAGAQILVNDKVFSTTDENGRYSINVTQGELLLSVQAPNMEEKIIDLEVYEAGSVDVFMEESATILDEVVFSEENITERKAGEINIKLAEMKRAPAFLGEVDIVKQIQSQPGVTTVGEVASGFNVRGGGVDQNLVLYDGIPVFNTAHALGFFSSFNSDVIHQAQFFRGSMPAIYGGRASSVLDITSKEGDYNKWHGGGGLGILSSYVSLGGPIKENKTSVMASIRASYSNWILGVAQSNYRNLKNSELAFYDGSLKLSHKFNEKSKLIISGYTSHDRFVFANDTAYSYQNLTASIAYHRNISNKLFFTGQIGTGSYSYLIHEPERNSAFDLQYSITYPSLKFDFNYEGKHKLGFGWHSMFYEFSPGTIRPASAESEVPRIKMPVERALESALYISDDVELTERLSISGGLRLSFYGRLGGTEYLYQDGPKDVATSRDSVVYNEWDFMKTYVGLEPRISFKYRLHENGSLKFGYDRMRQSTHLVTNTAAVTPVDIWQSSNAHFKPQIADQLSLGYYRTLDENTIEAFAEVFYKRVNNVLDFKDGANLILNRHLETALLPGVGKAFGVEVSGVKTKGRLQGNINYTYSRSLRKVNGRFSSERINDGDTYSANVDQPHVVNMSWRYAISRRYFVSGNFTYHTGRPMSVPIGAYSVDGVPVLEYSDRNKYRIPDYHRLDVAIILEGGHKKKKLLDGTWSFSLYNVYNRRNAYSVFFKDDGKGNIRPYQLSVIGSIIPSLSYSFKF